MPLWARCQPRRCAPPATRARASSSRAGWPPRGHLAQILIKRIVAGPGDLVSISGGRAVVDGKTSASSSTEPCDTEPDCNFPTPTRVPPGQYYLLGDDRGASDDSRFWGPIPASWIVAVAVHCRPLHTACQLLR